MNAPAAIEVNTVRRRSISDKKLLSVFIRLWSDLIKDVYSGESSRVSPIRRFSVSMTHKPEICDRKNAKKSHKLEKIKFV